MKHLKRFNESKEESNIDWEGWKLCIIIDGVDYTLQIFSAKLPKEEFFKYESITDENIQNFPIHNLPTNIILRLS